MPSLLCLGYYSGVLFGDDDPALQWFQQMMALDFAVLRLRAFPQTVHNGITTGNHMGRKQ